MTDNPVFDSHHHLWDTRQLAYSLFRGNAVLDQPRLADNYVREARALGVSGSLCIEAASAGADGKRETEWLLRHIERSDHIRGVVAWAPLEHPGLGDYLSWLRSLTGKPIVGVRRSFEFEGPDFAQQAAVIDGARLAGEHGLVVDLVLFSASLAAATVLVDTCPNTQFVLDHLGKPPIRTRRWQRWADELHNIAQRPNIVGKLSGLVTEADHASWTVADLRPYAEHALTAFTPSRLLYGSDWPVTELAGGHAKWLAAARALLRDLEPDQRDAVLRANALRVYGFTDDRRDPRRQPQPPRADTTPRRAAPTRR